jgi:hypothetical protein
MKALFVATATVLAAGPAWCQSTSSGVEKPAKAIQGEMNRSLDALVRKSFPQEWQPINPDASIEEIMKELGEAGWDTTEARRALSGAEEYNLLTRALGPGIKSFLAVPRDNYSAAIEFSPSVPGGQIFPAFWNGSPSSDEIRQEIVDGMQAAIDALCGMRARPSSIRAQASAFGVVEVEATWEAAEVCD